LGAGLVAFASAKLESGVKIISEAVGLRARMKDADLCITGEGKLDSQSVHGKTAYGVAEIAREASVPVICICGIAEPDGSHDIFADVRALVEGEVTVKQAMRQAEPLLKQRTAEAVQEFLEDAN
jgi:glycerate kinase